MSAPDSGPLAHTTAADVLRWGRAQPADSVVGKCMVAGECLIAEYALRVLGVTLAVCPLPAGSHAIYCHNGHIYPLSAELNRLASRFDSLAAYRICMHPADLDRLEATP